jgi:hypothetical protein
VRPRRHQPRRRPAGSHALAGAYTPAPIMATLFFSMLAPRSIALSRQLTAPPPRTVRVCVTDRSCRTYVPYQFIAGLTIKAASGITSACPAKYRESPHSLNGIIW